MIENKQKVLNLLGLAQKAGKITSGNDLVLGSIKQEQAKLVFLAQDASENTVKELTFMTNKYDLTLVEELTDVELSQAIGKQRKILAVTDRGFANPLLKLINHRLCYDDERTNLRPT